VHVSITALKCTVFALVAIWLQHIKQLTNEVAGFFSNYLHKSEEVGKHFFLLLKMKK
jgi:hypothetical protein